MKSQEEAYWLRLLASEKPLNRAQRDELARIIEDYFERLAGKPGRPQKTALEHMYYDTSTGFMDHLLTAEMEKGLSRRRAAAGLLDQFNANAKAHGLKPLTLNGMLKRIERWRQQRQ